MYSRIMVPIDLQHVSELGKAIDTAAGLASQYSAELIFVGVSGAEPNKVARFPREYVERLETFAEAESERTGVAITTDAVPDHDVAVELSAHLVKEAQRLGADLIVMATHRPTIFGSHAGYVAQHAPVSVMVVRS